MNSTSIQEKLRTLSDKNLRRRLVAVTPDEPGRLRIGKKVLLNFSSNDYLGLSRHPAVIRAAQDAALRWGTGSGASRLLSGNWGLHEELEGFLASFKKEEAALVFSSGYLAALGAVASAVDEKDLILVDRENHSSLVDAARLSRAKLWAYEHLNLKRLAELLDRSQERFSRRLVITDSYFSMSGDVAPLDDLTALCHQKKAMLMVDEAHATGVFGKKARGLTEHFGVTGKIDIVMGTLSKALGSVGGFIAGSAEWRELLINRARTFIYTTAPAPATSAAALAAIRVIETSPDLHQKLWANVDYFRGLLLAEGFSLMNSEGPVVPVVIGDTKKTLDFSETLKEEGFFVPAIRPPTVPKGTDRLRISVTADHKKESLAELAKALKKLRRGV